MGAVDSDIQRARAPSLCLFFLRLFFFESWWVLRSGPPPSGFATVRSGGHTDACVHTRAYFGRLGLTAMLEEERAGRRRRVLLAAFRSCGSAGGSCVTATANDRSVLPVRWPGHPSPLHLLHVPNFHCKLNPTSLTPDSQAEARAEIAPAPFPPTGLPRTCTAGVDGTDAAPGCSFAQPVELGMWGGGWRGRDVGSQSG
ncbi:hypothetical protein B0H14DRAFT_1348140 [Mycena olivaceomarginata]|nr:hypothetical protein B0H14DRAFT_1348140 [Mycena olivaceomarginata]